MRTWLVTFLPYCLFCSFFFIPQDVQKNLFLWIQEKKLLAKHAPQISQENFSASSFHEPSSDSLEKEWFHESLDTFSPWVLVHIVLHKETPWSHMAWIDIGEETQNMPFLLQQGCPVVFGRCAVGIVEQVGKKTSLIRLLTDPLLRPSVQVQRNVRDMQVDKAIRTLLFTLKNHRASMAKETHAIALEKLLKELLVSLPAEKRFMLAKGELQGAISLQKPMLLRGEGFNYDVGDELSPSRDIRTGQISETGSKIALIQPKDLLVTNGLDGLFPKGLDVAFVDEILPLEEGDFSYEIVAKIACAEFTNLHTVALLPAQPRIQGDEAQELQSLVKQIEKEVGEKIS